MRPAAAPIHISDCSVWGVPAESQPDVLLSVGYRDERVVVYLSSLRPVYDGIKRCLGQMAGLLLLLQTRGLDPQRGDLMRRSMREQLAEASDRLRSLRVPEAARRHFAALELLLDRLKASAERLDLQVDFIDPSATDLDTLMTSLFAVHHGLLAVAEPRAGISPVDFRAACCTCRPRPIHQAV
jgi:hypothetical protein